MLSGRSKIWSHDWIYSLRVDPSSNGRTVQAGSIGLGAYVSHGSKKKKNSSDFLSLGQNLLLVILSCGITGFNLYRHPRWLVKVQLHLLRALISYRKMSI